MTERAWSIADALDRLAPPGDDVWTCAARARLHALAANLPAALTRVIYLEAWIGQPRPRLDLIVKIDPGDRGALASFAHDRPLASFARAWAVPGSRLDTSIRAAWLELDLDPEIAPAAPRVFVDFTREAQSQPSIDARLDLAAEVVSALAGAPPLASLRTCLAHLPAGASLASVCVLADGVRACVVGLGEHLPAYLAAIGWPGDLAALARRLDPLAQGAQPVGVLHLDLAPDVRPRIGLEYTFPRPGRSTGLRSVDRFLHQLVARGWCTARNRESLRSWPRRSVELLPHDVWHSQVTRDVAHVKLTYTPGEPVVAKAYLRATFDLLAGGTLLGGRPRRFDGVRAPSDGGPPPSPLTTPDAAAPKPPIPATAGGGTPVALPRRERRGVTDMTMSTTQQEALEQILTRASVDPDFRNALLIDPRKAILEGLGVRIPANFRVKFIERGKDVDALIVLPDLIRLDGELDDCDLDAVAGGGDTDPPLPW